MELTKAKALMKEYALNNYNANKTLPKLGYSKSTAKKASKRILNSAIRTIAKDELKNMATSSSPLDSLLGIVRLTQNDVINEYGKVVKQDKDLSTKLKALVPLLRELGIKWDNEHVSVTTPVLNITTRGDNTAQPIDRNTIEPQALT